MQLKPHFWCSPPASDCNDCSDYVQLPPPMALYEKQLPTTLIFCTNPFHWTKKSLKIPTAYADGSARLITRTEFRAKLLEYLAAVERDDPEEFALIERIKIVLTMMK